MHDTDDTRPSARSTLRKDATRPMPHSRRLLALWAGFACLLISCAPAPVAPANAEPAVQLRLAGSTSMLPLVRELAAAYEARHPNVSCDIIGVGSTGGLELLARGQADLALVSRALEPDEAEDAQTGKRLLTAVAIAQDAVAMIVNERNPLRDIDPFDLRKLFQGRITDWADLGGLAGEITVVSREDGSATREVFEGGVMMDYPVSSGAVVMPGSAAVADYVAKHEGAIGYVSLGYVSPGVAALTIGGVRPERAAIQDGRYPITRPFLLVSPAATGVGATAFVQFAHGPVGLAIARRLYGDPPVSGVR